VRTRERSAFSALAGGPAALTARAMLSGARLSFAGMAVRQAWQLAPPSTHDAGGQAGLRNCSASFSGGRARQAALNVHLHQSGAPASGAARRGALPPR